MEASRQLNSTSNLIVNSTGNTIAGAVYQGLELAGTSQIVASLSGTGTVALGSGTLVLEPTGSETFSGAISDGTLGKGGTVTLYGLGTQILSGTNTYTGATFVVGGTLEIDGSIASTSGVSVGNGGTVSFGNSSNSTFARNISNGIGGVGTLLLHSQNTLTLSGALSDGVAGQLTVTQNGNGTAVLEGTNTYTGATNINFGNLEVDGSLAAASTVNVHGVLSGFGTVGGTANVFSGGTILPGNGVTPGTLTVGNLILNPGSTAKFLLPQAGVAGGGVNGLLAVTKDLTLGGTLSLTGSFGVGDYTLLTYGGTLSGGNFSSITGLGSFFGFVDTSVHGKVILDVFGTQYWDGSGTANDGIVSGGSGNWNNSTNNWTNAGGTTNSAWQGGVAAFGGPAGTVKLTAPITAEELTFNSTGYILAGTNSLKLVGFGTIDVTNTGDMATVNVPITGSVGLNAGGAGTLILTSGSNSYTGVTVVSNGVLQIGAGTSAAKIGSGAIVIYNGGTLSLGNLSGTTFSNSVTNGAGGLGVLQVLLAKSTTLSGPITDGVIGKLGLTQGGSGTTILTNAGNNFSGATTISNGTLEIGSASAAGSIGAGSPVSVGNNGSLLLAKVSGGVLANNISNHVGGTGTVNVNSPTAVTLNGTLTDGDFSLSFKQSGTGTTTLTGNDNYTGATTVSGGTLQVGNGTSGNLSTTAVTVSGTAAIVTDLVDGATFAPSVNLSSAGSALKGIQAGTNTFSGVISGLGVVDQNGAGKMILTQTETYTGATNVNLGTLEVDGMLAAGSTVAVKGGTLSGTGTIQGKATLAGGAIDLGSGGTIAGTLTITGGNWNGAGTVDGAVTSSSGTFTVGNGADLTAAAGLSITGGALAGTGTITSNVTYKSSSTSTFGGVIADSGTTSFLTVNKAGSTFVLSGINTYTGATNISAGTLQVGNGTAGSLSSGSAVTVNTNATLSLDLPNAAGFSNTLTNNGHLVATGTGNNFTISSTVTGSGNFAKSGSNTVTVTGANTFKGGTIINGGNLLADNATGSATGTGAVTVNSGATLGGSGTITGASTLNKGGNIEPGAGSLGTAGTTLHESSLIWNGGSTITLQLGASTVNDALALAGALTKGSAGTWTIDLLDAGAPASPTTYTLLTFASTTFKSSDFTLVDGPGLTGGSLAIVGGSLVISGVEESPPGHSQSPAADLSNTSSSQSTFETGEMPGSTVANLTPTPEPGSALLLAFGTGALLGWRRRRSH
jgi:autotransporter-associated beta strand protein